MFYFYGTISKMYFLFNLKAIYHPNYCFACTYFKIKFPSPYLYFLHIVLNPHLIQNKSFLSFYYIRKSDIFQIINLMINNILFKTK